MTANTTVFASGVLGAQGIAFDSLGYLYCATSSNNTIHKITPNGSSKTILLLMVWD